MKNATRDRWRWIAPLFLVLCASVSVAQTLTIRVLDAKSGKPLSGENITLRWDNDASVGGVVLALDREACAIQAELERSGYRAQFDFVTRWAAEPSWSAS